MIREHNFKIDRTLHPPMLIENKKDASSLHLKLVCKDNKNIQNLNIMTIENGFWTLPAMDTGAQSLER